MALTISRRLARMRGGDALVRGYVQRLRQEEVSERSRRRNLEIAADRERE